MQLRQFHHFCFSTSSFVNHVYFLFCPELFESTILIPTLEICMYVFIYVCMYICMYVSIYLHFLWAKIKFTVSRSLKFSVSSNSLCLFKECFRRPSTWCCRKRCCRMWARGFSKEIFPISSHMCVPHTYAAF